MGTRIPHPPFSTPTIEDLAARDVAKEQAIRVEADESTEQKDAATTKRTPRKVPITRRRKELPSPGLAGAATAIAVALFARSPLVRTIALIGGALSVAAYLKGYRTEDLVRAMERTGRAISATRRRELKR